VAYIGRFAPSPTGPLHAGSLVAALASWLDARAHGGQWLVRVEDTDTPRCPPGTAELQLAQLARCGLHPDGPVWVQSQRHAAYEAALALLAAQQLVYPCTCSRRRIEQAWAKLGVERPRHAELLYPGTCRPQVAPGATLPRNPGSAPTAQPPNQPPNQPPVQPHAWRLHTARALAAAGLSMPPLRWTDRRLGLQAQDVLQTVGDFVLRRSDGLWAYQLAVVVDDGAQGITHIVRGQDLADNTPRQILLQRLLGLPTPHYLHTPLVLAPDGEKLSKQNGAQALRLGTEADVLRALNRAAHALGLPTEEDTAVPDALARWTRAWKARLQSRA
jgi:glutamyl-Q tRNA(Asp) synthetase